MRTWFETVRTCTDGSAIRRPTSRLPILTVCILAALFMEGCGQKALQQDARISVMPASLSRLQRSDAASKPKSIPFGPPLFREVSKAAGIDYRWEISGKRPLNILQTIGNGCAFFDYDHDGNLDILLVGPKPALYRGDGQGHFTDVTRATGLDRLEGPFLGLRGGRL